MNFKDLLRLILSCGSTTAVEQIIGWSKEQFEAFLNSEDNRIHPKQQEMLERLDSVGTETLIVSDNEDIVKNRPFAIKLPNIGSDAASPFLFAVFAQLFACKLTAVKGLNPDAPRNLKKVTVTV